MRIDQEWLEQQREEAPSDERFLADCLSGQYRTTAKNAAASALTCAQSMPFPDENDPEAVVDLMMQEAADSFAEEHETYASELEVGDVVLLGGEEHLEVTGHRYYEDTTARGRRFFGAHVWFDGADEPSELDAECRLRRFSRPKFPGDLVAGDVVMFGNDEFVFSRRVTGVDELRVWFEGDPEDSPWVGDSGGIMQVRVLSSQS